MKRIKLTLIVAIIAVIVLGIATVALQEVLFQREITKWQQVNAKTEEIYKKCGAAFSGSHALICENTAIHAILEIEDFPDLDLIKSYDAKNLEIIENFERHTLTATERDAAMDKLNEDMDREINKRDAAAHTERVRTLFPVFFRE